MKRATRSASERVAWVLTCEHASSAVPRAYRGLGVPRAAIRDHIGWDVGAHAVQREIARRLQVPYAASRWSRLLVDCNRDPLDPSLIVRKSDGVEVPGNARVGAGERRRRLALYHAPYHAAVDRMVARAKRRDPDAAVQILALHSFTPVLDGAPRPFDVGVLFDAYPVLARRLGRALAQQGYRVRYNEPYSGLAGLIYSARRHGEAHDVAYVELEINNALLRSPAGVARLGRDVARALACLTRPCKR
ncbi:MAG: N-formylglutamate amidohydrolase [Thermodesulfobacteriota bacterium]